MECLVRWNRGARKLTLPSFDSLLEALGITYEEYFSRYNAEETEAIQKVMQILHSPNIHLRSYFAIVIEGLLLIHQRMKDEPNDSESFIKCNTEFISSVINSYTHSTKKSS